MADMNTTDISKEEDNERFQSHGNQAQNTQQASSGPTGFFQRIFFGTAPPPVRPQTNQVATNIPPPSTDPFSRPFPGYSQQQTTQFSQPTTGPFVRPPPPPYPGVGYTSGYGM
ncbi:hypothetical protein LOTGIDRAFT_175779 [Lottia gigantea]|uniref:Uncharacterized protein n=1 Tax=Lottia gigantea TaxID=225164 RepID=V3ZI43_LOTGI|nr:hypothetical protein LOTGIDRAFT_175779 [Lottia gigantea]ESO90933.1 hypothetical protein LOTGIDRAFT_175779 [Lottia gigantea]